MVDFNKVNVNFLFIEYRLGRKGRCSAGQQAAGAPRQRGLKR
jgi:hypothetical protein